MGLLTCTCVQMFVNDNEIFIKVQIRMEEKCYFVMWHFCRMCALMTLIIIVAIQHMQSVRTLILGSLAAINNNLTLAKTYRSR